MFMNKNEIDKKEFHEMTMGLVPEGDTTPWYAIRLFSVKLKSVMSILKSAGIPFFVPYREVTRKEQNTGSVRHYLTPVVTNYVFIKLEKTVEIVEKTLQIEEVTFQLLRRKGDKELCLISASEMKDFIMMCNPAISERKFISEDEASLCLGDEVIVKCGPMKGYKGKLVRKQGKYFLLKTLPGVGVMLSISRWNCKKCQAEVNRNSDFDIADAEMAK